MPASGNMSVFWTPEKIETMIALAGDKQSAGAIALAIGAPTRNYVIGKCRRMGIKTHGKVPRSEKKIRPAKMPKPVFVRPKIEDLFVAPECGAVSLEDINSGMCHWPLGDGYCGKTAPSRQSYCPFHAFISTTGKKNDGRIHRRQSPYGANA